MNNQVHIDQPNYIAIISGEGGFWTDTKAEAWEWILGWGLHKNCQLVDIKNRRFLDIKQNGEQKAYFLSDAEIALLIGREK